MSDLFRITFWNNIGRVKMDQKQKAGLKKRILVLEKDIVALDNTIAVNNSRVQQIQGQINQQLQRKFALVGGAVELNRLLPEEERFEQFKTVEEPKMEPEPEEESEPKDEPPKP